MSELFDNREQWTEIACDFDRELKILIRPLFQKYYDQGHSLRELFYISESTCKMTELEIYARSKNKERK